VNQRLLLAREVDKWPDIRLYVTAAHEAAAQEKDIQASVIQWFEGAIGDIQAGLDRAGRYEPSSRRIRAVLAFGRLEFFLGAGSGSAGTSTGTRRSSCSPTPGGLSWSTDEQAAGQVSARSRETAAAAAPSAAPHPGSRSRE
jgi:hypothetical protein